MFAAKNQLLKPPAVSGVSVSLDSIGAGVSGSNSFASSMRETHVIGASANYLMVGVTAALVSGSDMTPSGVTCGSSSMTLLQSVTITGNMVVQAWGLASPPTGSQTITVNWANSFQSLWVAMNSVAYKNVGSIGTASSATNTGTSWSITQTGSTGQMIFNVMGASNNAGSPPSGYNQTTRGSYGASSSAEPTIIGDAPGAGSVTFSATSATGTWAAVAVPMNHT